MERRLDGIGVILLAILNAYADGLTNTKAKMTESGYHVTGLQRALIIRNETRMGVMTQNMQAEVSEQMLLGVGEGVQISSGTVAEDYQNFDEFILVFPARPINGLTGQLALALSVEGVTPTTRGTLTIRRASVVQVRGQFSVRLDLQATAAIKEHWAYTRHPHVRKVYMAMFDDPDTVFEGEVFHYTVLPSYPTERPVFGKELGWTTLDFLLPPEVIERSEWIDRCEALLEVLDEKLAEGTGQYLQWLQKSLTLETIETVASEAEKRFLKEG